MRTPKPEPPDVQPLKQFARDLKKFDLELRGQFDELTDSAYFGHYKEQPRYVKVRNGIRRLLILIASETLDLQAEIKAAKP